jgi:hypothetical protein
LAVAMRAALAALRSGLGSGLGLIRGANQPGTSGTPLRWPKRENTSAITVFMCSPLLAPPICLY